MAIAGPVPRTVPRTAQGPRHSNSVGSDGSRTCAKTRSRCSGGSAERELRQLVLAEEADRVGLDPVRLALGELLAEEVELPAVEREARPVAHVAVQDREQPRRAHLEAGLLPHLLLDRVARRLADLGPAAGQRPGAVVGAADEQHRARRARRRRARRASASRAPAPGRTARASSSGSSGPSAAISTATARTSSNRSVVERVRRVVQPVVRDRLQPPHPVEPASRVRTDCASQRPGRGTRRRPFPRRAAGRGRRAPSRRSRSCVRARGSASTSTGSIAAATKSSAR